MNDFQDKVAIVTGTTGIGKAVMADVKAAVAKASESFLGLTAFLASPRAGFCTGGDYLVDGGLLAGIAVK